VSGRGAPPAGAGFRVFHVRLPPRGRSPRLGTGTKPVRTAAGAWAAFEIII